MNTPFFIARRLALRNKKTLASTIIRLAIVAITLSMTIMIVAMSTVSGFKQSISDKIFGFWGHIHIKNSYTDSPHGFEARPINLQQTYYPHLDTTSSIPFIKKNNFFGITWESNTKTKGGIRHIQPYANREGIIKTKDQIEGIILRGVSENYDWSFLNQYLVEGRPLNYTEEAPSEEILLSTTTAQRLKVNLGDKFLVYFVQGGNSVATPFKVVGLYKTGLAEYDRLFALVDLRRIQKLNNWRPYRAFSPELYLLEDNINLFGLTEATLPNWTFLEQHLQAGRLPNVSDSLAPEILISNAIAARENLQVGDTYTLHYNNRKDSFEWKLNIVGVFALPPDAASVSLRKTAFLPYGQIARLNYDLPAQVGGFEVFVEHIDDIAPFGYFINYYTLLGKEQYADTIKEVEPDIFDWLNLTDMNETIILVLMIGVSLINMTTALLILILERTNMIGLLKGMGASNWFIRKIFLYHASYITFVGLLLGNILGIGLCLLQAEFGFITLPEDLYYVSTAPVRIEWLDILLLNIGTLGITFAVLIVPSWLVARIHPVKAIRFQ